MIADKNKTSARCYNYHIMHYNNRTFWCVIHYLTLAIITGLSAVVAIEGVESILPDKLLLIFGVVDGALSVMIGFINPGSKYTNHLEISKKYKELYHKFQIVNDENIYQELYKELENIDKDSPDIMSCFYKGELIQADV